MLKIKGRFKKILSNTGGFTIVEMLTSVFIIALLSGIFLANMRAGEKQSELALTTQRLVSDVRTMQMNALGALDFNNQIPLGGWGLKFSTIEGENNRYNLFANLNEVDMDEGISFDSGEEYRRVDLPESVKITSLETGAGIVEEALVVFVPPDPIVYINDSYNDTLRLTLSDGPSERVIEINFFGLIDIVK